MKIKAKHKYHKLIYFSNDDLECSGKDYYEYTTNSVTRTALILKRSSLSQILYPMTTAQRSL